VLKKQPCFFNRNEPQKEENHHLDGKAGPKMTGASASKSASNAAFCE